MNFATLQGLTIPEGVVTQIADASGRVLWMLSGGKVILEVEKITSDTYAGETTYTGEQFILLDIYPKTNGTVKVTYGGLTKTITDTSGAKEPNAQQVFFGTFNGVSDSVTTPASGTLTIAGDFRAFSSATYATSSKNSVIRCDCIIEVTEMAIYVMPNCFNDCTKLTSVNLKDGVEMIGYAAFFHCTGLTHLFIPASVESIYSDFVFLPAFASINADNPITVDENNPYFYVDGNCLIRRTDKYMIAGFNNSVIPDGIEVVGHGAFYGSEKLTHITFPSSIKKICTKTIIDCELLTSVTFADTSGWYVTETEGGDASTGTSVDVSDPTNNVKLLRTTYANHYWYRS